MDRAKDAEMTDKLRDLSSDPDGLVKVGGFMTFLDPENREMRVVFMSPAADGQQPKPVAFMDIGAEEAYEVGSRILSGYDKLEGIK